MVFHVFLASYRQFYNISTQVWRLQPLKGLTNPKHPPFVCFSADSVEVQQRERKWSPTSVQRPEENYFPLILSFVNSSPRPRWLGTKRLDKHFNHKFKN